VRGTVTSFILIAVVTASVGCGHSGGPSAPTTLGGAPASALITIVDVGVRIEVTAGGTATSNNWAGQSVRLPAGTPFNNIRFHWYTFQGTPTAFGTLYLLIEEYLGPPANLSPATAGFLARSEQVSDGVYIFSPAVRLDGGAKYWFYTDTAGAFMGSFDQDIYPDGDLYVTGNPSLPFRKAQASGRMVGGIFVPAPPGVYIDANFKLQGNSAP
jgi:hypothetical protein